MKMHLFLSFCILLSCILLAPGTQLRAGSSRQSASPGLQQYQSARRAGRRLAKADPRVARRLSVADLLPRTEWDTPLRDPLKRPQESPAEAKPRNPAPAPRATDATAKSSRRRVPGVETEEAAQQLPEKPAETRTDRSAKAAAPKSTKNTGGKPLEKTVEKQLEKPAEKPASKTIEPPARPLSARQVRLRDKVRGCLRYYYQRPEDIAVRSPWGVMHCLISYGVDAEVIAGSRRVNAIGWLCWNQPCFGMQLMALDGDEIELRLGPGYQGHEGQFLSMLALSKVKTDYPMRINGRELTVADLVQYEQQTCRPRTELSFKLIGLAHYLDSEATWASKWGEQWSIARLIREEITQPINGACCGGMHRLMGLSVAVHTREKRNEPISGDWLRAKKFVRGYQRYLFRLQNRDGSFSTDWFKGRADSGDVDRKLQTTGHMLEWLVYSLPENELNDPRVVRAVSFLANHMITNRQRKWEIGPRGHALRALALYGDRVFGDKPGQRRQLLAGSAAK